MFHEVGKQFVKKITSSFLPVMFTFGLQAYNLGLPQHEWRKQHFSCNTTIFLVLRWIESQKMLKAHFG